MSLDQQQAPNFRTGFEHLPKREPAPESEMDKERWEGHHSICQTIRDIYHITDDGELKLKCRVAMAMTKAMHEKLKKYKQLREEKRGQT
jgi:hypothetical protein